MGHREEILSKFNNGEELYNTSPLFRSVVDQLTFGFRDIYEILHQLVLLNDQRNKDFQELLKSGKLKYEIVVTKERFDELLHEYGPEGLYEIADQLKKVADDDVNNAINQVNDEK